MDCVRRNFRGVTMSFLNHLKKATNSVKTENDAKAYKSTLNPVLDFFALAGAMRGRPNDALRLFRLAFKADPQAAVRCLFYLRDVRGGQGERNLFRICFNDLAAKDKQLADSLAVHIPEYGRWDDYLVPSLVKSQLEIDEASMAKDESVSLMAKWLPSENSSSKSTRDSAVWLAEQLGLSRSQYRKRVVALRKYIGLLEHKMSGKQWSEIDYSSLPSQAMRKHLAAFRRHDNDRFSKYLGSVAKGESKINTSTLYTYEVFDAITSDEAAANIMWKNLPDYTDGLDSLVMADVSGSMWGRPMSVSVSLALYFAERNTGIFKDHFMTFSESPDLVEVVGNSLTERLSMIKTAAWGMNTNLQAAFESILNAATSSGQGQSGMPNVLYIISDMELDVCTKADKSLFKHAKKKFAKAGLRLPHVVFWNVNSRQDQLPATILDGEVTLISGASQSAFKYAVEGTTPEEFMLEVINSERYNKIMVE